MKKFLAILLSSFYLLLSVGATVNFHYCGGNLSSVKVYSTEHQCCCKTMPAQKEMKGCCEDETFLIQFDETQNTQQLQNINLFSVALIAVLNDNFNAIILNEDKPVFINNHLPPPVTIAKYIAYSSLIFYA